MNEAASRIIAEFDAVANDPKALHEWVNRPFALTSFLDVLERRAMHQRADRRFPPRRTISYDGPDMNEVDAVLEELEKLS
jgi:hypothetical protein